MWRDQYMKLEIEIKAENEHILLVATKKNATTPQALIEHYINTKLEELRYTLL